MPAFSVLTALPFCFSEIVKPGPTVPISFGGDMGDEVTVTVASSATAPAARSVQMSFMGEQYAANAAADLGDGEAALHRS